MIISTLTSYPGKKVVKDLGIVYAYDDFLRGFRTLFKMDEYLEYAFKNLEKKAKEKGANALLGVSFCSYEEKIPMVIGTAVVLEDE